MKIAFKGFRGFGDDSELTEIGDLTILTGKNSSGKSTFIKIFRLLTSRLNSIENFKDIFNLKIDLTSEEIGGIKNLVSTKNIKSIKWVFTREFEFYIDEHQIHIIFNLNNYYISVENIELYSIQNLKKPLCIWNDSSIEVDVIQLMEYYNTKSQYYNLLKMYQYVYKRDSLKTILEPVDQYKMILENSGYSKAYLKNASDRYIKPEFNISYGQYDTKHPFKEISQLDELGLYMLLSVHDKDELSLTIEEIENIVKKVSNKHDIKYLDTRQIDDPTFPIYNLIKEIHDEFLGSLIISKTDYSFQNLKLILTRKFSLAKLSQEDFFLKFGKHPILLENEKSIINISEWLLVMSNIFSLRVYLYEPLYFISLKLFENNLLDFFHSLSDTSYFSSYISPPSRSYNIFSQNNIFSEFMRNWKMASNYESLQKLKFLNKYIKLFNLGDSLKIEKKSNVGYIYLRKKDNSFSLIDEGSGINNIIALLLFLANQLDLKKRSNLVAKSKTKFLIIEEPETNLHPSLQSMLAELFIDVVNNFNFKLIVETHSEYLIRKLQINVARGMVQPELIRLKYFNFDYDNNHPGIKIKNIYIKKDGTLSDEFGTGFFDEADNISIELFTLKNSRNK